MRVRTVRSIRFDSDRTNDRRRWCCSTVARRPILFESDRKDLSDGSMFGRIEWKSVDEKSPADVRPSVEANRSRWKSFGIVPVE